MGKETDLDEMLRGLVAGSDAHLGEMLMKRRELEAGDWSREKFEVQSRIDLALSSCASVEAQQRLIASQIPFCYPQGALRGLVYRGERPLVPFVENPWGIAADASFEDALGAIWRRGQSIGETARALLASRLLGVALRETTSGLLVAYLDLRARSRYDLDENQRTTAARLPRTRARALDWAGLADFSVFVGEAPAEGEAALPIPPGLAQLYAVHRSMTDSLWNLHARDRLQSWAEFLPDLTDRFQELTGKPASSVVEFFGYGDDRADLFEWGSDRVYSIANPWEPFEEGESFGAWLDRIVREQMLHLER